MTEQESDSSFQSVRGLVLAVCASLLALLVIAGIVAVHSLSRMHEQEAAVRRTLTERTQMLIGLWASVENYRDAVDQLAKAPARLDRLARTPLDQLARQIDADLQNYPGQGDAEETALVHIIEDAYHQQREFYVAIITANPTKHEPAAGMAARSRHGLQELSARLVDAQESERRAISRELHDEVGQSLGALLVDIGRLSAVSTTGDPTVRNQLEQMKSAAERSFHAVRNMALLLRPSMLDDLGLTAALEWLGREVSRNSEIEVTVQSENVAEGLPDACNVCIYRLVQAALHNAVRHSGARNATVRVDQTKERIRVQVADNGRGFDPARTRGMGLLGMKERVKRLGGVFRIESQPGRGATVIAELPPPSKAGASE